MSLFDWLRRKSPAEKIATELEVQFQTKGTLERLVREIDRQLANLNPRILRMERNGTSYTKASLTKLKA